MCADMINQLQTGKILVEINTDGRKDSVMFHSSLTSFELLGNECVEVAVFILQTLTPEKLK